MSNKATYLVTQTRSINVDADSAAEARNIAETIIAIRPDSKRVSSTIHIEKVRN